MSRPTPQRTKRRACYDRWSIEFSRLNAIRFREAQGKLRAQVSVLGIRDEGNYVLQLRGVIGNTMELIAEITNLSTSVRICEYSVTVSVPAACLTFDSAKYLSEILSGALRTLSRTVESTVAEPPKIW
jgi:hypothetical protein